VPVAHARVLRTQARMGWLHGPVPGAQARVLCSWVRLHAAEVRVRGLQARERRAQVPLRGAHVPAAKAQGGLEARYTRYQAVKTYPFQKP